MCIIFSFYSLPNQTILFFFMYPCDFFNFVHILFLAEYLAPKCPES